MDVDDMSFLTRKRCS